ncbi:MAG TPA: hypothetical protein VF630_09030 [Hymenobacter sp.]|jgi:hypothetical protein
MTELSPAAAAWLRHYASGYFTRAALEKTRADLEDGSYQFAYAKHHEGPDRLAALRHLLARPELLLSLPNSDA